MAKQKREHARSLAWMFAGLGPRVMLAPEGAASAGGGDGGGQGGGDGTAAAAAAAAGQAAGGPGGASDPSSTFYRPDGLPDHFYGANDRETIDKLFSSVKGYRDADATRGTIPKEPTGYKLEASDKVKPYLTTSADDDLLGVVAKVAHQHNITDRQYNGFVNGLLEALVDDGLVEPMVDFKAEIAALVPEAAKALPADQQQQEAARRINDALAWAKGLESVKGVGKAGAEALVTLGDTAAGVQLIEWIRARTGDPTVVQGGAAAGGQADTPETLRRDQADPRNDPNSAKYDPAFARELKERYAKHYGN